MKRLIITAFYVVSFISFLYPLGLIAQDSDESIVNQITAYVSQDASLKPYTLRVDASNGRIKLSGTVNSEEKRLRIEQIAKSTKGVRKVKNNLVVSRMANISSDENGAQTCAAAKQRLDSAEELKEFNLSLECSNGIVTVTGTVRTERDAYRITQLLRGMDGVQDVVSHLRTPPEMSDTYLEQVVRSELLRPGDISLDGLLLSVEHGVVIFQGHVSNHEYIDKILSRTLMIKGVKDIKSEVTIGK